MLPSAPETCSRQSSAVVYLLAAWTIANYVAACRGGFSNDDFIWIDGAWIAERGSWLRAALVPHPWWSRQFVRPMVQLSFFLNYLLGGVRPWPYHALNVALHTLNVLLLYYVIAELVESPALAAGTAFLFSVHPYHAWAVGWVSGRTQLICGSFMLFALLRYAQRRWLWAYASFGLALLSNEAAISVPIVALMSETLSARPSHGRVGRLLSFVLVVVLYLLARWWLTAEFAHGVVGLDATQPASGAALATLLRNKLTLIGQYLLAPLPVYGFWRSLLIILGLAALVTVCAARRPHGARALGFAGVWVVTSLLPYAAWYQFQPWYTYVPAMGLSLLYVTLAREFLAARVTRRATALCGVAALLWVAVSVSQLQRLQHEQTQAGLASVRVLTALTGSVSAPPPHSALCLAGLAPMRLGAGRASTHPLFVFGLEAGVRLWFQDASLDTDFAAPDGTCTPRPQQLTVRLTWDGDRQTFERDDDRGPR